ncbi:MAG: alpha/beta hydrolase [Paracoccaceae bacterium]
MCFSALFRVLLVLAVTACAPRGEIVMAPADAAGAETRPVFVATTRAVDETSGTGYSRTRSEETRFARLDIAIPPLREAGSLDLPRNDRRPDPTTEFLVADETVFDGAQPFRVSLAQALRAQPAGGREVVVFVHGFNTTYAEGAYRTAQLAEDLNLPGVMVHYAWPSRAQPLAYAYDRDSALFSRDGFEHLLKEVAAAHPDRIIILAHSMGGMLTMETLRQLAISRDRNVLPRIGGVVLMSPDLDVDVFRAQAKRIGNLPQPFVIFTSERDRALNLAARLSGQTVRLGNLKDTSRVADLEVTLIEVGAYSSGLGHFTAGTSPVLLGLLREIGQVDAALAGDPAKRLGLLSGIVMTVQNATQIVLLPVNAASGALQ